MDRTVLEHSFDITGDFKMMNEEKKEEDNVAQLNRYFTIKPTRAEVEFIRMEYEESRRKRVSEGLQPRSLNRFLTRLIVNQLQTGRGDFIHGW